MTTQEKQALAVATADIIEASGWGKIAEQVRRNDVSPQAGMSYVLNYCRKWRSQNTGMIRALEKAQRLVGLPTLDVRHYCETGKKRYV